MSKYFRYEPIALAGLFWLVFFVDVAFLETARFGIHPREVSGLWGVFTAPFFHGSLMHIMSNTIPFLILGLATRIHGSAIFWSVFFGAMILGGLGTWLFSGAGSVVGASGIIFGFWAFLIAYGIFKKSIKSILIAVVVVILYGALIFSLFRFSAYVSWSGHFFGAASGLIMAYVLNQMSLSVPTEVGGEKN
jgi:membrane associated rhomboid family serine protease